MIANSSLLPTKVFKCLCMQNLNTMSSKYHSIVGQEIIKGNAIILGIKGEN